MRPALRVLLPPLAVFVLARVFLVLVSLGTARPATVQGSWLGPDSGIYLSIARFGYYIYPCSPEDAPPGHCGNTGWLPAYPLVIRAAMGVGLGPRRAAVLISGACTLLSLVVVWSIIRVQGSPWTRILALLVAAFFPGQVYQHAAYPISLFTLATLLSLLWAGGGRWVLSGLAGAVAALSYPPGVVLAPMLLAHGALRWHSTRRRSLLWGAAIAAGLTSSGFIVVLAIHYWATGVWNAFFLVQSGYGHGLNFPWVAWWQSVRSVVASPWEGVWEAPGLQTLFVASLVVGLCVSRIGKRLPDLEQITVLCVAALWLFPLLMGPGVSLYRSEAMLLPATLLMGRSHWISCTAVLLVAVTIASGMAVLFFRLNLV